eukprot:TRINITY_DN2803_c0_g1_i1.p1 TRINITY_DN2803_c0_g1~~TRINITY_DN2803_c0_g1_i1.p1  ORF type:complete len:130 (-),score=43.34 TRINITY_DN2803_c0_g1_i1:62-451(-)
MADLTWAILRQNSNSFVRNASKGSRVQFSSEPGNLLNLNKKRFSGLATAQPRSFTVSPVKDRGYTVSSQVAGSRRVARGRQTATLKRNVGVRALYKSVKKTVHGPQRRLLLQRLSALAQERQRSAAKKQ